MEQKEIIGKLNVVDVDVSFISGTVSKDETSSTAFTGGAVRYIDPIELRTFATARQAVQRACKAVGTRFLGGWAVPDEKLDALLKELDGLAAKVAIARQSIVTNFEQLKRDWMLAHPEIATYQSRFPDSAWVDKRIQMKIGVFKIIPQEISGHAADAVHSAVSGMAATVLQEIAQEVKDCWKPNAGRATSRIHNLLGRIVDKLHALQFVGGNLSDIAHLVEDTAARLPKTGSIEGYDYQVLSTLLSVLQDPDTAIRVATSQRGLQESLALGEKEAQQQESLASLIEDDTSSVGSDSTSDFENWFASQSSQEQDSAEVPSVAFDEVVSTPESNVELPVEPVVQAKPATKARPAPSTDALSGWEDSVFSF